MLGGEGPENCEQKMIKGGQHTVQFGGLIIFYDHDLEGGASIWNEASMI